MNQALKAKLNQLIQTNVFDYTTGIKRGFEKESLRVDQQGYLSQTSHPVDLGSSLMHPMITTDFSEALLEFITSPLEDSALSFKQLYEIHQYTYHVLQHQKNVEYLWPASMPCGIPKESLIPLAQYGPSNLGRMKTIYRNGLGLRYSRKMQTISGLHYNFSFSIEFWQALKTIISQDTNETDLKSYISEQYLAIIRNVLRFNWFLPLLFGASPAVCTSFLSKDVNVNSFQLFKENTFYGPYATSLRLSELGYHNKKQVETEISYNSLTEFIQTMHQAVHTIEPEFAKIGVLVNGEYRQLSACQLQIEDEHYAMIRPKRVTDTEERLLSALMHEGIEYLEVRALDINPLINVGVSEDTVYIIDTFLLLCLLLESPPLTVEDLKVIRFNKQQVVNYGRKPGLKIKTEPEVFHLLQDKIYDLLIDLKEVSKILDKAHGHQNYSLAIEKVEYQLKNSDLLPSAQLLTLMHENNESFFSLIKHSMLEYATHFTQENPMPLEELKYYQAMAFESHQKQKAFEQQNKIPFSLYLEQYLSI